MLISREHVDIQDYVDIQEHVNILGTYPGTLISMEHVDIQWHVDITKILGTSSSMLKEHAFLHIPACCTVVNPVLVVN